MEHNPFTTIASREVYRNPWIRVREDDVVRPDGSEGIYGVVEKGLALGVVALTDADEVVLVGQYRYTLHEYSWELVEGGRNDGEEPLAGIQRELAEETGLVAEHWEVLVEDIALSNSVMNEHARLWLATGLHEGDAAPEATEVLQVRRVPFEECLAMVDRCEITDAMSVIGLLALDRRRRAG